MTSPAPRLNESQLRRILTTLGYVDELLAHVEEMTQPDSSPFAREKRDLTPDEARLLRAFVQQGRRRMLEAIDRLGIPRPEPSVSAHRSASTSLLFAESSLSELDPGALRGYGALDEDAGREVAAVADDLRALMARGRDLLQEQEAGGLAEQIAAVRGPVGEILQALLRLSTERGLAEVRPLLAAAAERARGTTLDVGVFGRVSSGKSSLINALVGEPVLPVGATPVTAVPVRIARDRERVVVEQRNGPPLEIPVKDLPLFATEEHNPQNRKGVRSIQVTVPGVPEGLRLLDTPGVGSLASSGSAQAFAWLPRCDLGLVLVAAGTPVGTDEAALVAGLIDAGIDCRALLSKADLFEPPDRERARSYVAAELRALVGREVQVRGVSTRPGFAETLDAFRKQELAPLAADHAQKAREALRLRLHRLVAVTAAALAGQGPRLADSDVELRKARAQADEAIRRQSDGVLRLDAEMLDGAAQSVVQAWSRGEPADAAARRAIVAAASRALAVVREAVDGARSRVGFAATHRRLPPLFDPPFLDELPPLEPPRLAPKLLKRTLARRALAPLEKPLDEALARYASRLRSWGEGALEDLARSAEGAAPVGSLGSGDLRDLDARIDQALADQESAVPQGAVHAHDENP